MENNPYTLFTVEDTLTPEQVTDLSKALLILGYKVIGMVTHVEMGKLLLVTWHSPYALSIQRLSSVPLVVNVKP